MKFRFTLLLVSSLCSTNLAQAQDTADNSSSFMLEEVLVTANRRVENLQEVPMSVSAFSGEFFKDAGVNDLTDLEQYTPSLTITPGTDSRSTAIRIRGIGSVGTNTGIDPSVGMFIDGVYQGRAGMSIGDLMDIERVEVLRGPQGTLYGKNTAAGAISIITRKPGPDFESEIELVYAKDNRKEIRGMVNVPLGDNGHATRLTAYAVNGDHLYRNTVTGRGTNDADKWGAKARTLFELSNGTSDWGELFLSVDYSEEDTDCCALAVIDYSGFSTLNAPLTAQPSADLSAELGLNDFGLPILVYNAFENTEGFAPPLADPYSDDYWFNGDTFNRVEVGGVAAEWNIELASQNTVTAIAAWRHYQSDSAYDGDFSAYNAVLGSQDEELDQYSLEARITSPGGATWDYQAGLYAYYSEFDSLGTFSMRVPLVENIGLSLFFPDGTLNIDANLYTTTSFAAFGQLTWNISDEFSATFGLRYTSEKKEREGSQLTTPRSVLDLPPVAGPDIFYDAARTDDDLSPTINLRWFPDEDSMFYASISRGFKSGGYNQRRELEGNIGEFDEETATNYELGWKGTWLDRRLQVNGTAYLVNYDDFQSQSFDGSSIRVTNAGSMKSQGTEIEIMYAATPELTIGSAIGYNKAEYDEFDYGQCTVEQAFREYYFDLGNQFGSPGTGAFCAQDLAGKPIDNAPEWTFSSFLHYEYALSDNLLGILRLEHNYIDSLFLDADLDAVLENDPVDIVNLRLTLTNPSRDWEVALWTKNLLDEEYLAFGIDIPTVGGYAGVPAPGQTYGITFRMTQ